MSLIRKRWSISGEHSLRSVVNAVRYVVRMNSRACLCYEQKKLLSRDRRVFAAAHFHIALVAARISHFLTAATKFSCCFSNKNESSLFFISRSRSLLPFFSLSFAGLPPTFSFSLSFSSSIFQIYGHDDTDAETISAFRFRLDWLFSRLCFTRHRWLCDFPPK